MPGLGVLFLGSTGVISSACSWLAVERGAREIVAWHDENGSRQRIDAGVDALSDMLAQAWRPGG